MIPALRKSIVKKTLPVRIVHECQDLEFTQVDENRSQLRRASERQVRVWSTSRMRVVPINIRAKLVAKLVVMSMMTLPAELTELSNMHMPASNQGSGPHLKTAPL